MMVFISNRKLHVSAYNCHHQGLKTFFAISVIYNMNKRLVDVEICISKPDDGRYRPKHVVSIANKHHHLDIY